MAMAILIPTLLPFLFFSSLASAWLQVSIDCGASKPYTDKNGIKWTTDESYVTNGDNQVIKSTTNETLIKTLRVFTTRKKNCYSIDIKGGGQVLLRASFNYGNYDGKSSPPTFQLMFDANLWAMVETSMDGEVYYEIVYVTGDDVVSLCVGQTDPGQFPFVSAIQMWQLPMAMYPYFDNTTALSLYIRSAYGTTDDVRYPDDAYDRIWSPAVLSSTITVLTNDAKTINTTNVDEPPAKVLENAITPTDPSSFLTISTGLPSTPVLVYMNMYFTEQTQLSSTDERSFAVFAEEDQISDSVSPIYGSVSKLHSINLTASGATGFSLRPTTSSTLPPIISAMEVFSISDTLSTGTDVADADGLAALMVEFPILQEWSGDPCLPVSFNWDWVGCSSDDSPRITSLHLSGYGLSGKIPDFSSLVALETVELQNNSISGGIPAFLGSMANLEELNLADNDLSGPIPSSVANNNKIKLVTTGNTKLCAAGQSCHTINPPPSSPGTSNTPSPPGTTARKPLISYAIKKKGKSVGLIVGLTFSLSFVAIVF